MPRKDKPVRLREVDDEAAKNPVPVIRLGTGDERVEIPVRVVREEVPGPRLELPDRKEAELRTHQPDIGVLLEPEVVVDPDAAEQSWGEAAKRKQPVPWGWFVLLGLTVMAAIMWSLTQLKESEPQVELARSEAITAVEEEESAMREAGELVDHIESALKQYFMADSMEGRLRMVRHPERVRPLMNRYYAATPLKATPVEQVRTLRPLTLGEDGNFWSVSVELRGGVRDNVIVEVLESGEAKIDWETLVVYQPMPWNDFVAQRPSGQSMDFRVWIEADEFHSHEFSDPEQWSSFRLTAPGGDEPLFGYARRESAEAKELAELIQRNGGRKVAVILRLLVPDGLQSRRGVVIEKIRNFHWIYQTDPGTGS